MAKFRKLGKWLAGATVAALIAAPILYAAEIGDLETTDASNTARFPEGLLAGQTNDNLRALEGLLARGLQDTIDGVLNSTSSNGIAFNITSNRTGTTSVYTGLAARFVMITGIGNNSPRLSFNSISAVNMVKPDGTNVLPGELVTNQIVDVVYSLGKWWVMPQARTQPFLSRVISPTTITSQQDNYAPTGIGTAEVVYITKADANVTITGLLAGRNGQLLYLVNMSGAACPLILDNESGSSTAANRFSKGGTGDYVLAAGDAILLRYDGQLSRWVGLTGLEANAVC